MTNIDLVQLPDIRNSLEGCLGRLPEEWSSEIPGRRTILDTIHRRIVPFPVFANNFIAVDEGPDQMLGGKEGHVHYHPDNREFFVIVKGLVRKVALHDMERHHTLVGENLRPGNTILTLPGIAHSFICAGGTVIAGIQGREYDPEAMDDFTPVSLMGIDGQLLIR